MMREWARDDDLWVRRTAVLSQVRHKDETDTALLHDVIEANLDDRRSGCARRSAGRCASTPGPNPAWVRAEVDLLGERLSGLSRREATRRLPAARLGGGDRRPARGRSPTARRARPTAGGGVRARVPGRRHPVGRRPERLGERGFRCLAPTWPLGAHRTPMRPGADLSPRGVARVVVSFLDALDLTDVVLVGNDTGGAVCQLLLDEDPSRLGQLVLTNCDAFDSFPPASRSTCCSGSLARLGVGWALLQPPRIGPLRTSPLGFGTLTRRRLTAPRRGPGSRRTSPTPAYAATSRRSRRPGPVASCRARPRGCAASTGRCWSCGVAATGSSDRRWPGVWSPRSPTRGWSRSTRPTHVRGARPAGAAGRGDRRFAAG